MLNNIRDFCKKYEIKKFSFLKCLIIFALLFLFFCGCQSKASFEKITLSDKWEWCSGHNSIFPSHSVLTGQMMSKLDAKYEQKLHTLVPSSKGFLWLRYEFSVPETLKGKALGLNLGRICSAAEVYVNGASVGTVGKFPPNSFEAGTAVNVFTINSALLKRNATNTIVVKLYVDGHGSISSDAYLGELNDVILASQKQSFWLSSINIVFVGIMLVTSIFYMMLFLARKKEKAYFDFSLASFFTLIYLIPFCSFEYAIPSELGLSFLTCRKIFVDLSALFVVYFTSSFMIHFLKVKELKSLKIIRFFVFLMPCLFVVLQQTYVSLLYSLPIIVLLIFAELIFGIVVLVKKLIKGSKDALHLLLCYLPVVVTVGIDSLVHYAFLYDSQPWYTIYGWQLSNFCFLALFAKKYSFTFFSHDKLQRMLEAEVKHRTLQLENANSQLEIERTRFKYDLDMAIQVQRNYLPSRDMILNGWESAVYFSSVSGLSADLYDYYFNGKNLSGFSLFEVSGEGLSAGLIAMIAQNAASREFYSGYQTNQKLPAVMEEINLALIEEKGKVDNFFSGMILRVGESFGHDLCHCEVASVGVPLPILYNAKTNTCYDYNAEASNHYYGMLGISGVKPIIASVHFDLSDLDTIVCFSDGLVQVTNAKGEPYSTERIELLLKQMNDKSPRKIVDAIQADLESFAQKANLKDDVTVLVIKRNKNLEFIQDL